MGKAECLDELLQAWRHLPLIPPEAVSLDLVFDVRKHDLDLAEFLSATGGGLQSADAVTLTFSGGNAGGLVGHDTVEEEDHFLREVRDIATMLLQDVERLGVEQDGLASNLDETFSPVVVIVDLVPEILEDTYNLVAGAEVDQRCV